MKPVKQTKLHSSSVKGNCLAACYASLFEIDIKDVPAFEESKTSIEWEETVERWLSSLGIQKICVYDEFSDFKGLCIANGPTIRDGVWHAVIYENGKMIHDPHPSNEGLTRVERWIILAPLDPKGYLK